MVREYRNIDRVSRAFAGVHGSRVLNGKAVISIRFYNLDASCRANIAGYRKDVLCLAVSYL